MKNIDVYHDYNCIRYHKINNKSNKYNKQLEILKYEKKNLEDDLSVTDNIEEISFIQNKIYNLNLKIHKYEQMNDIEYKKYIKMNQMISLYKLSSTYDNKKNILKKYILEYNPEKFKLFFSKCNSKNNNSIKCCGSDDFVCENFTYNIYKCKICGKYTENKINEEKFLEHKINNSIKINNYKRYEYFNKHLEVLFLQNNKNVTDTMLDKIQEKIKTIKKYDFTKRDLKFIINKLNMKVKNDNIDWIYNRLIHGKIELKIEDKRKMTDMFLIIEKIWNTIRGNRRSFINYKYCILKILQLMNKYKNVQQIIKSRFKNSNILILDKFWYKICKTHEWDYYPTYC